MDQEFINKIARNHYKKYVMGTNYEKSVSMDDLIHEGIIGYLQAQQKVDNNRSNEEINSFIYRKTSGAMLDMIRKQALVKMPQIPYTKVKMVMKARKELEQNNAVYTDELLAKTLGWSVKEIHQLLSSIPQVFSANRQSGHDGENIDFFERYNKEDNYCKQEDQLLNKEISELLQRCIETLDDARMRLVISSRHLEDITLQELADRFGCTAQAIYYQEQKGLSQMKSCLDSHGWQWQ